jgi:tetratricopeptide (TPR) repeat protein
LTLRLLGGYLALAEEGDIRKRDRVEFEDADREFKTSPAEADKPYGHAFKVMAAYERWLASGGDDALRQLAILRLLGLFDRPLDVGCLAALRQEPAIPGLTDRLVGLSDTEWTVAVVRMEQCGLVSRTEQDNPSTSRGQVRIILPPPYESRRRVLDSHPLIREYFAQQLREKSPQAWREAHRRLYEHLRDSTPDLPEPTLDDLQPLYQAVAHGCRAELYEAAHRTFLTRISRGNEAYGTLVLGAAGADLAAVTWFFKEPWHRIVPGFPTDTQARLLNAAGFYLQTLGRLTEALGPLRAGLPMELQQNDWVNAAIRISNICAIELLLGEIALAAKHAEQAVELANRSGDETRRMLRHTTLAHVKHEMGLFEEAELLFRTAEQIQTGREPKYPILYSIQGYQYCDILLIIPERLAWQMVCSRGIRGEMKRKKSAPRAVLDVIHAVCQRASKTLDWVSPRNWTLDIALDHLTLGRAALYRAILETSKIQDSKSEIEQAVASLRRAGQQDELPRGLLTRAWFRLLEGDAAGARADLDEAWEIAERGSMRLHMADIHLHRARLFHDKDALAEARKLINQCGYHRRDEELADAEEAAKKW